MSTSLLMVNMQKAARKMEYETEIEAHPISMVKTIGAQWDILLLGPQVRFHLSDLKRTFPSKPVASISMKDYGRMDGKAVIEQVRLLMQD